MSTALLIAGLVVPWLLLTVAVRILYVLLCRHGRLVDEHEALLRQPARRQSWPRLRDVSHSRIGRSGLEAGAIAPSFTLPDLNGETRSLEDFQGRRLLLVFSDPQCGPCQAVAPRLQELATNSLDVVMISRGSVDDNRAKARQLGLTFPIVLQRSWEISKAYEIFATPVGYLIDENGVISKDVAVGGDAILALAR